MGCAASSSADQPSLARVEPSPQEAQHQGLPPNGKADEVLTPNPTDPVKQIFDEAGHITSEQTLTVEPLPVAAEIPLAGDSVTRAHQCVARHVHLDGVDILALAVAQGNAVHLYSVHFDGKQVTTKRIGAAGGSPDGDPVVSEEGGAGAVQHTGRVLQVGMGSWVEFADDDTDVSNGSGGVGGGVRTWGAVSAGEDNAVCLWNVVDGQALECMGGATAAEDEDVHTGPVTAGCYIPFRSPAGAAKAAYWTAGEDTYIRAWSLMDGYQTRDMRLTVPGMPTCMGAIEVLHPLEESGGVQGGSTPAMLTIVATGTSEGRVELRNFAEGSVHCTLSEDALPGPVRSVIGVWWERGGVSPEEAETERGGAFLCDRGLALLCDQCHDIFVYKPSTEHMVCTLGGHEYPVVGVCMVHPPAPPKSDEAQMWGCDLASSGAAKLSRMASLDSSGQVRLWNLGTGACERAAQLVAHSEAEFVGLSGTAVEGGGFVLAAATTDSVALVTLQ